MVLDWRIRLALVIGGVLVIGLAIAGDAWGDLDLGSWHPLLVGIGSLLVGIGGAGGRGAAAAGLLLAVSWGLSGCGAACQTERTVVDALGEGLEAADTIAGDQGGEEYERASYYAHGAHALGAAAVDACELVRDGAGWQAWVGLALEAARAVAGLIDGAGPADVTQPVPAELTHAIGLLEAQ